MICDVVEHAMKHDEESAVELWDEATGDIFERTRKGVPKQGPGSRLLSLVIPERWSEKAKCLKIRDVMW